ncbi:MAG: acyl-protein synthetase [Clostridiales bacterium]|nr:acyl-protein synthetase [Clostridiales bacterium]
MNTVKKLFRHSQVYDHGGTDVLFLRAIRENASWHYANCKEYREILDCRGFHPDTLQSYADLGRLPPIPTLYLKQGALLSIPPKKLRLQSTSSGTSGKPVAVGFDVGALGMGATMLWRLLRRHELLSLRPANYLILGYQPAKHNKMGAVRTAHAATFLAPALHREYALADRGGAYELNIEGVSRALLRYSHSSAPVRIIGFPAYFYFLLQKLEQENVKLTLPRGSMVFLGGGWKQFAAQRVEKTELYRLAEAHLGIPDTRFREFFGVVEHNVPYFDCIHHHFHVPIYSRVLIRDVRTMEPVGYGEPGLLNLLTPILKSMPLVSIMTDDLAILHEGQSCPCGNPAPWFEILGRAGLSGIQTCAAGAGRILEGL